CGAMPMKPVRLEPLGPLTLPALHAMLADRRLRASLFGGSGRVDHHRACSLWSAPTSEGGCRFAACCADAGIVVGGVGAVAGELAFFSGVEHEGSGYGSGAVRALLLWWRDQGLPAGLRARTTRENRAARRVLDANGFREVGLETQPDGLPCLVRYLWDGG